MTWNLTEAKNHLSELVNRTLTEGPQRITRRNDMVIVITEEEYNRLCRQKPSFKEALLSAPSFEGVDLSRDHSPMREVSL
jgi:antitoxin Phd